ncbi:hypothetical protein B0O99DRAFT_43536 [Bisporella sp. PMI_857]|nr:hypothetical protein B0O99DRAFT_43536 [Bisporella sp. PMI_857]
MELYDTEYKGPFIYVSDWIMERVIHRRQNRDELEEGLRDGESEQKVKEPNDKIASKNQDRGDEDAPPEEAPNILLNLHHGSKISNLVIAAVAGILLQVGVLVFSGFIVYVGRLHLTGRRAD